MTVNVNFLPIANAIAGLTISGVTTRGIDKIPASVASSGALLAPRPAGFVTDFSATVDSFGTGGAQKITLAYTLNYNYYHCMIGSTLDFGAYSAMITKIAAILVALLSNDVVAGAIDQVPSVSDIGPVLDPVGNTFHGCTISLRITQYAEVT